MNKKEKIALYLFQNSINSTGRKKTKPIKDLAIDRPVSLSNIGMNYECDFKQLTIRVQFSGSAKFYTMGFSADKVQYWFNMLNEFVMDEEIDFESDSLLEINKQSGDCDAEIISETKLIANENQLREEDICSICGWEISQCIC